MTAYGFIELCGESMSWCTGKYDMCLYSFIVISESRDVSFTTYGRSDAFRQAMHLLFKAVVHGVAHAAAPASCDLFDEVERAVRAINGHAAKGHAANDHVANGHVADGHAANGHAMNGHAAICSAMR